MSNIVGLYDKTLGHLFAPIKHLLDDESISEVMINGCDEIYIERKGLLEKTDVSFKSELELEAAVRNVAQFVGKRLTEEEPSIEARLPDGSRVHIVQAPAARKGLCVAIRKFSKHKLSIDSLIKFGSLTDASAEFLKLSVLLAKNIIVSGGTGSGKTTLLNCLSSFIGDNERIIVLEDSSELQLQQEHVVPFEAQAPNREGRGGISIRGLFRASLRMRPDRIVVGECRGGETVDMIQAMTSGHAGSLSTCHANTPLDALSRLEVMSLMGDVDIPLHALRTQISSAIDLIVQINRFHDGVRKITAISEVLPLGEDGKYQVQDIFALDHKEGQAASAAILSPTEVKPGFAYELQQSNLTSEVNYSKAVWA